MSEGKKSIIYRSENLLRIHSERLRAKVQMLGEKMKKTEHDRREESSCSTATQPLLQKQRSCKGKSSLFFSHFFPFSSNFPRARKVVRSCYLKQKSKKEKHV